MTWLFIVKSLTFRIKNEFEKLSNEEFLGRTDDEVFELVWKANGANNLEYEHLSVLEESVWLSCCVSIDETIDAWLITMTEIKEKLNLSGKD